MPLNHVLFWGCALLQASILAVFGIIFWRNDNAPRVADLEWWEYALCALWALLWWPMTELV